MHNDRDNQKLDLSADLKRNSQTQTSSKTDRRGFFHVCFILLAGLAGFITAFPVFAFFRLPNRINRAKSIEVPLSALSEGQSLYFEQQGTQIVLIYTNREPKVFDSACPHLGCLVKWDQDQHAFLCPCHGAIFDDQGKVIKGPVNAPLKSIKFEIKNNILVIA